MLRARIARIGYNDRPAWWWQRSNFSSSRMRTRPVGSGDGRTVREALDACCDGVDGWSQDVEEPWKLGIC